MLGLKTTKPLFINPNIRKATPCSPAPTPGGLPSCFAYFLIHPLFCGDCCFFSIRIRALRRSGRHDILTVLQIFCIAGLFGVPERRLDKEMSRAAIPQISYKNKTANFISNLGTVVTVIGVLLFVFSQSINNELLGGIGAICLIGGLACIGIVWLVMKNRSYQALMKMIQGKNLEPVIASSAKEAVALYRLAPSRKLEKYIAKLNPEAGRYIAQNRNRL